MEMEMGCRAQGAGGSGAQTQAGARCGAGSMWKFSSSCFHFYF